MVDAASTPVPEVEDDKNVRIVISSDAQCLFDSGRVKSCALHTICKKGKRLDFPRLKEFEQVMIIARKRSLLLLDKSKKSEKMAQKMLTVNNFCNCSTDVAMQFFSISQAYR